MLTSEILYGLLDELRDLPELPAEYRGTIVSELKSRLERQCEVPGSTGESIKIINSFRRLHLLSPRLSREARDAVARTLQHAVEELEANASENSRESTGPRIIRP